MRDQILADSKIGDLLLEAAEWRLTGLLFECPSDGWQEQITALASEVTDADLKAAVEAAKDEAIEGLYHSISGPGGPAPAREVSYSRTIQPGYLISELYTYYDAFSYRPSKGESPDHISVEAGFISYLRFKEAYALACCDTDHATLTRESSCHFIEDHISTIAGQLFTNLKDLDVRYLALACSSLLRRTGKKRGLPIKDDNLNTSCINESGFDCCV